MNAKTIKDMIATGLQKAMKEKISKESKRARNQARSRAWVESLARQFRKHYDEKDVRVFSKHNDKNRKNFRLNELLYDVCVCKVGVVTSSAQGKKLEYVREALWQVESEFAKNSHAVLIDFSKLVLGSAPYKLIVSSPWSDPDSLLNVLTPAASACTGTVYAAMIPHPNTWDATGPTVEMWEFRKNSWAEIK